jgi:hypothetical protein
MKLFFALAHPNYKNEQITRLFQEKKYDMSGRFVYRNLQAKFSTANWTKNDECAPIEQGNEHRISSKLLLSFKEYKVIEKQGLGETWMSKEVINVGGEEKVVREDTAKSYRGVIWALGSIGIFIIIAAIILFVFFFRAATDKNSTTSPANIERQAR